MATIPSAERVPPWPTLYRLKAALRSASVLGSERAALLDVRDSYRRLPSGGLYRLDDLVAGEQLLLACGLINIKEGQVIPSDGLAVLGKIPEQEAIECLLSEWLRRNPPLWSRLIGDDQELAEELIPTWDAGLLADVVADPDRREAILLRLARKHDLQGEREVGIIGEELVVQECRALLVRAGRLDLAEQVQRVSLISDQLGYDVISPHLNGTKCRIEVKTCGRTGNKVRFILSRAEAAYAARDPSWCLVVCQANRGNEPAIAGWLPAKPIQRMLPGDSCAAARWASVEFTIEKRMLISGLPIEDGAGIQDE